MTTIPKPYNGHHCWNCWNVSLWIGNDEGLYRAALDYRRRFPNAGAAARHFREDLPAKTPDGATYTQSAVRAALIGLE